MPERLNHDKIPTQDPLNIHHSQSKLPLSAASRKAHGFTWTMGKTAEGISNVLLAVIDALFRSKLGALTSQRQRIFIKLMNPNLENQERSELEAQMNKMGAKIFQLKNAQFEKMPVAVRIGTLQEQLKAIFNCMESGRNKENQNDAIEKQINLLRANFESCKKEANCAKKRDLKAAKEAAMTEEAFYTLEFLLVREKLLQCLAKETNLEAQNEIKKALGQNQLELMSAKDKYELKTNLREQALNELTLTKKEGKSRLEAQLSLAVMQLNQEIAHLAAKDRSKPLFIVSKKIDEKDVIMPLSPVEVILQAEKASLSTLKIDLEIIPPPVPKAPPPIPKAPPPMPKASPNPLPKKTSTSRAATPEVSNGVDVVVNQIKKGNFKLKAVDREVWKKQLPPKYESPTVLSQIAKGSFKLKSTKDAE